MNEKARAIKAQGAVERGEFNPSPGSAHLKMYKWWRENAVLDDKGGRENFCHYWRVVVFWGPLTWITLRVLVPVFRPVVKALAPLGRMIGSISPPSEKAISRIFIGWLCLLGAGILMLLVAAFVLNPVGAAVVTGVIIGGAATLTGLVLLVSWIVDHFEAKKDLAREALREAWYNNEISDDEYFGVKKKREPGKISKFFHGIGDFLVLIAQVVRVKKWKICPFVEIPE